MTLKISQKVLKEKLQLRYAYDDIPGFTRRKWGRGFQYLDDQREKLKCDESLKRIKSLVIPPMWKEVWICKTDNGHLQSTGRDLRNRKQYIYHVDWVAYRQAQKFSKMLEFSQALPNLRETIEKHLGQKKWNRKKVLALAVKVLDEQHLRIGNQQYAERNGTYGLTTLRRKHLEMEEGALHFSYKAKSNKYRNVSVENPRLVKLIQQCSELPGHEIFRYKGKDGKMHSIDSSDVNEYIHEIMGEKFTAKDFRTWGGTSLAVKYYEDAAKVVEENSKKKLETTLVKMVSKELGNTVSVCRKYYIHPVILKLAKKGDIAYEKFENDGWLDDYEIATQQILREVG